MFDWFDEPVVYYRRFAPMRSGVFDYMARWMDSVDRAMVHDFGDFYDSFYPHTRPPHLGHQQGKKETKEAVEKKEDKSSHEDKDDTELENYCISSKMYSGSDGTQHIYREESDSKSGQRKTIETRRIGNKSMTLHRVTNKDGTVEEHETLKNIKEDELEAFKKDWLSRKVPTQEALSEPEKPKAIESHKK